MNQTTLKEKQAAALDQGKAYDAALQLLKQNKPHVEIETEDYIITWICESAEGMHVVQPEGDVQWNIPREHQNQHLEVAVQDKKDLRFIPELNLHLDLFTSEGSRVISTALEFVWHPYAYHYGANVDIPESGEYKAEITIKEPLFDRHDLDLGRRYLGNIKVNAGPLMLTTGRNEYREE